MENTRIVENFILSLPVKPLCYHLSGSRARGTNRPDSDWDIAVLYERDDDVPMGWIMEHMDDDGLFAGKVDFHYFAKDWAVFKVHPELLKELFPCQAQRCPNSEDTLEDS